MSAVARVGIVTDSTACIPRKVADSLGIRLVPMTVVIGGREYLDGVDLTPEQFYEMLLASPTAPTTSHPPPGRYLEAFIQMLQTHEAVVCTTLAAGLSGVYQSAQAARGLLPEATVVVEDTGTAAGAQGLLTLAAARAAAAGAGPEEVVQVIRNLAGRVRLYASVDTLDYLARGGRLGKAAALLGGKLKIKPILTLRDGIVYPSGQARTIAGVLYRLVEMIGEELPAGCRLRAIVMHAALPEPARDLAERLRRQYDCAELHITAFTPVMGAHIGPGLIGVAFYGEPAQGDWRLTEDLSAVL